MYSILLSLHSWVRWLVLVSLLLALFVAYRGWFGKRAFSKGDDSVRHWTATIAHIQFLIGLGLYFISPIVDHFLSHFGEAVHQRIPRFFGMEHSTMMFIAIAVISTGSAKAKRMQTDRDKYKTMAIWFTIGLLLILSSIPWAFSPLVSRPHFRPF